MLALIQYLRFKTATYWYIGCIANNTNNLADLSSSLKSSIFFFPSIIHNLAYVLRLPPESKLRCQSCTISAKRSNELWQIFRLSPSGSGSSLPRGCCWIASRTIRKLLSSFCARRIVAGADFSELMKSQSCWMESTSWMAIEPTPIVPNATSMAIKNGGWLKVCSRKQEMETVEEK